MTSDDDTEKTHDPTPKKLEDARKRGEVPKSIDLNAAASLFGFVAALMLLGLEGVMTFSGALAELLANADDVAEQTLQSGGPWLMGGLVWTMAGVTLPLFGLPALLVIIALFGQRAIIFAPDKLAPKLNRISPIEGAKNKFGAKGIFEFGKSATKLVLACALLVFFLLGKLDQLVTSTAKTAGQIVLAMGSILVEFLMIVFVMTLAIGGIDYLWQHAQHIRKNRMSMKDMKDEAKESDGDPQFKQQRRQRAYDIAMNKMLSDVPTADVIIVNPTHYAVALKWDKMSGNAPICVAKGVDEIAARIREVANDAEVPIFSDPPTARALHATLDLGRAIEPDHYQAVAAAIRFAEGIRAKARRNR
ncbi:EscU/YscU/HrcU family type III secretion system export apparatus switch protein [Litoreibacter roseus]|uniref:Flagellar biosynthesis protein FlhB n=1 Tax=Litoreibacter roseus TaxID=2601869 RepID=A0A6N6JE54_9RHOB|nr:flagellar type III secretion system protein FlhB [Litoreibacter roseus]GFE64405.1 flagellar biosynthesis protein FlhB [Litoreibacter roseus]